MPGWGRIASHCLLTFAVIVIASISLSGSVYSQEYIANFTIHRVQLSLGQSYDLGLQVRNLQTDFDVITIDLSGYSWACFLNTTQGNKIDCDTMQVGLNPSEERTVFVRVVANKATESPKTLVMDAASGISTDTSTDTVVINVGYPASFPGLSEWAIMALIILSFLVYTKIHPP